MCVHTYTYKAAQLPKVNFFFLPHLSQGPDGMPGPVGPSGARGQKVNSHMHHHPHQCLTLTEQCHTPSPIPHPHLNNAIPTSYQFHILTNATPTFTPMPHPHQYHIHILSCLIMAYSREKMDQQESLAYQDLKDLW